ncbi:MAG TPA: calcium/sodium antiporter [Candidatus Thioglobus sp.]|jgi:cation:H+ antiporter|nr:calcium/sodium antiporter [Candidatus Thioglobus sp.]
MFESIISLVSGFILLIWSADEFTNNGAKIANIFKISPLIIGLLIFGFGTSAPEMLVSGLAAYEGHPELSIGNAFGSNIFNIALVLGITAIILPIKVKQDILKKEWLYLMASTLVAGILILDGYLSFADGLILLGLLAVFLIYTFVASKKGDHQEFDNLAIEVKQGQTKKVWLMLIISFVILLLSAKLVVWGGSELAASFGVSDLLIGLTVVALGTSLPELAVSISSALKKQHEMVVGNIIGSNLFNTVGVLAIPSLILPFDVPVDVINRDYPFMVALTALLFIVSYRFKKEGVIRRLEGVLLLVVLAVYLYLLLWT